MTRFPLTAAGTFVRTGDRGAPPSPWRATLVAGHGHGRRLPAAARSTASRSSGASRRSGAGAEVTYGFADSGRSFPDAINCRELAPMRRWPPAWQGDPLGSRRSRPRPSGCGARGGDVSFRAARPGEAPDILIGAQGEPEGIAFANVWHGPGSRARRRAADPGHDLPQSRRRLERPDAAQSPGGLDLGTVLAHEIGHAIGLDHPGPTGALMGYSNQGDIDRLMPGDIAGAVALYGPAKALSEKVVLCAVGRGGGTAGRRGRAGGTAAGCTGEVRERCSRSAAAGRLDGVFVPSRGRV